MAEVGGGPLPLTVMPQLVDAPGASCASYDAATALTVCPDCVVVAFQELAIASDPGRVSVVFQVDVAVVPVFATLIDT